MGGRERGVQKRICHANKLWTQSIQDSWTDGTSVSAVSAFEAITLLEYRLLTHWRLTVVHALVHQTALFQSDLPGKLMYKLITLSINWKRTVHVN